MIEFLNRQPIPGVELNIMHLFMFAIIVLMTIFTFKDKYR